LRDLVGVNVEMLSQLGYRVLEPAPEIWTGG
jgi:hypothetical protein